MRLFGKLSSVTALTLSVMLLQPTNVQADPDAEESANSQLECAALYLIATAAYPNDEGRKQKLFREYHWHFHQVFADTLFEKVRNFMETPIYTTRASDVWGQGMVG